MNDERPPRPGTVWPSSGRKSIGLAINVWAGKDRAGRIHIRLAAGERFIVTVTNYEGSERFHRKLFRVLRDILIEQGKWPFGDEGSETETKDKEEEA